MLGEGAGWASHEACVLRKRKNEEKNGDLLPSENVSKFFLSLSFFLRVNG